MGSAVAVAVSLSMTAIVFLLLPEYADRLGQETPGLIRGLLGSWSMTALAATAFRGELCQSRWRRYPQWAVLCSLAGMVAWYWPKT